jgi:predicted RecB family nuclease
MKITPDLFEAFLKCPTKCWLHATKEISGGNAYAEWVGSQENSYRSQETARLTAELANGDFATSPGAENLKSAKWRLATNVVVRAEDNSCSFETCLHAVERIPSAGRGQPAQFVPIRFIYHNKLTKDDKLLLAFEALVLSETLGRAVNLGKIIHGDDRATLKVKTPALAGEVRKRLGKITALLASAAPPDLVLNRHCAECEFQARCRKLAVEKDDLSLLAGMSAKERQKLRSKGIFTVTQLSYTFRPRRRPRRQRDKREKYHHSLKALAIREQKIHIVGSPELKLEGTPVYLDVEGLPDRDFYYLIGVRIGHGDSAVQHSLWADTAADEGRIWCEFLALLETVEQPMLIHYGSYETTFLKNMSKRHGASAGGTKSANATKSAVNILSAIFAQIYFPVFTNGLKEIARSLDFHWSEDLTSGLDTLMWRSNWEKSGQERSKQLLSIYNGEDCEALERVVLVITQLWQTQSQIGTRQVVHTNSMKRETPFHFGNNHFSIPELEFINKAAYWDHQRTNVYVKSNRRVARTSPDVELRRLNYSLRINKVIECSSPTSCPMCESTRIEKRERLTKIVQDIQFSHAGIKRWNIRYFFNRYYCCDCRSTFLPSGRPWTASKFGTELTAYVIYLVIDLFLPQFTVAKSLNELFRFRLDRSHINHLKSGAAKFYQATYDGILNRITGGRLIHADETKVSIAGKEAYVWIFTNLEAVVYFYTESREGEWLEPILRDFKGVLITDFYAAYDSFPCPQQKCLIHLMRDLNDDLLNQPFNEELKGLTQNFAALLKPIIGLAHQAEMHRVGEAPPHAPGQ